MYSTELFEKISAALESNTHLALRDEIAAGGFEKVYLRYSKDPVLKEVVRQCYIRLKYEKKFDPLLKEFPGWLLPKGLPLQQASHHYTADFKSRLARTYTTVLDLTGGLGMDSMAFARCGKQVLYFEKNDEIFQYNAFNFSKYAPNIQPVEADSMRWIQDSNVPDKTNLIYADPARRDAHGKKVFHPLAYEPNPAEILQIAKRQNIDLLLKVSPMADLEHLYQYIGKPSMTYLLAVQDELKEVLLYFRQDLSSHFLETWLCGSEHTLLYKSDCQTNTKPLPMLPTPGAYMALPHAALVKTRADVEIAQEKGWGGFHREARIYTTDRPEHVPGWRLFKVLRYAHALHTLEVKEAMIVTGKFPDNPETLRNRHRIAESDHYLLVATKNSINENLWILAEKLI